MLPPIAWVHKVCRKKGLKDNLNNGNRKKCVLVHITMNLQKKSEMPVTAAIPVFHRTMQYQRLGLLLQPSKCP